MSSWLMCPLKRIAPFGLGLVLTSCNDDAGPQGRLLDSLPEIGDTEVEELTRLRSVTYEVDIHAGCLKAEHLAEGNVDRLFDEDCVAPEFASECEGANGNPPPCEITGEEGISVLMSHTVDFDTGNPSPNPLADAFRAFCQGPTPLFFDCPGGGNNGHCAYRACDALIAVCIANTLMETTQLRLDRTNYILSPETGRGTIRIGSQTALTNSMLAEAASEFANGAIRASTSLLASFVDGESWIGQCTDPHGALEPPEPADENTPVHASLRFRSLANIAATTAIEAHELYKEAIQDAVQHSVAAADAARNNPNALGKPSRSYAAGLLVDLPSFAGRPAESWCDAPILSGGARRAMDALRASGVAPEAIRAPNEADTIDTQELLYGTIPGGNVLERLVAFNGIPTNTDLPRSLGVRLQDFAEARNYLAEEQRAFFRDTATTVPVDPPLPFAIFAATRNAPQQPPPVLYVQPSGLSEELFYPPADFSLGNLIRELAYNNKAMSVRDIAYELFQGIADGLDAEYEEDVIGPMRNALQAGKTELSGRWQVEVISLAPTVLRSTLFQSDDTRETLVLYGAAGLKCAVNGNIEGTPCSLRDEEGQWTGPLVVPMASIVPGIGDTHGRYPHVTVAESVPLETNGSTGENLYLASPRGTIDLDAAGPGDFELLGVVHLGLNSLDSTWRQLAPEWMNQAGSLLTPDTRTCDSPTILCDGTKFDQRLPLEDELSDDGDDVESSWKYYLGLAEQAAAESDLRANEYLDQRLALSAREEELALQARAAVAAGAATIETVQQACGASVSVEEYREEAEACASSGSLCEVEQVVARLAARGDQEWLRIQSCIGGNETLAAVTLANEPLCYFVPGGDRSRICQTATGQQIPRCPQPMVEGLCPDTWVATNDHLSFFPESPEGGGVGDSVSAGTVDAVCKQLRDHRSSSETLLEDTFLRDDAAVRYMFEPHNLAQLVEQLGYEDEPGNYANLLLNGSVWRSTGNATATDEGSWLRDQIAFAGTPEEDFRDAEWPLLGVDGRDCGYDGLAASVWRPLAYDSESLFCSVLNPAGTVWSQRIAFNTRLRNAVLFLKYLVDFTETDASAGSGDKRVVLNGVRLARRTGPLEDATESLLYPFGGSDEALPLVRQSASNRNIGGTDQMFSFPGDAGATAHMIWQVADGEPFDGPVTFGNAYFDVSVLKLLGREVEEILGHPGPERVFGMSAAYPTAPNDGGVAGSFSPQGAALPLYTHSAHAADARLLDNAELNYADQFFLRDLTFSTAHDAVEIVCEANAELKRRSQYSTTSICLRDTAPLTVGSVGDLSAVANRIQCMADDLRRIASGTMLFNFPKAAADALKQESPLGVYPKLGGDAGVVVTELRSALIELHDRGPQIASQIELLRTDIEELQSLLQKADISRKIQDLSFWKETSQQLSNCAVAVAEAGSVVDEALNNGAPAVAAAATCINSAIQITLSTQINALDEELTQEDKNLALTNFRRNFEARASALRDLGTAITTAQERLDSALIQFENIGKAARRSLSLANYLMSPPAQEQNQVNAQIRQRFDSTSRRYKAAHQSAKHMAFIARRAVEARVGRRLADMTQDLPLVDAPATWSDDICISYSIQQPTEPRIPDARRVNVLSEFSPDVHFQTADFDFEGLPQQFIGDYVDKLRAFMESYRLTTNFHEGEDVAVVSLRDELLNVRAECSEPSRNLVANSGSLDAWASTGCEVAMNCIAAVPLDTGPVAPSESADYDVRGYRVTFGQAPNLTTGMIPSCSPPNECGATQSSRLQTPVDLTHGEYLVSWYARQVPLAGGGGGGANPSGEETVAILRPDGSRLEPISVGIPLPGADGWARHSALMRVAVEDLPSNPSVDEGEEEAADGVAPTFTVAIVPDEFDGTSQQVDIAAVQVEVATRETGDDPVGLGTDGPLPFEMTDERRRTDRRTCEDTTGEVFRGSRWHRGCVHLCPNGFTSDCSPLDAEERCYQEASFSISQGEIESGHVWHNSGFAYGNFNYRIDSIALNFVGTDLRDCSESELPQSCYSGAFVPYTLIHDGPYFVRNYEGEDFEAKLFQGRIEHARGLASERYITNPLADGDRSLLQDYLRTELRGRPLDGAFVVRVWEDGNNVFSRMQDIQVVFNYRYWTRFR